MPDDRPTAERPLPDAAALTSTIVGLSSELEFVDQACIEGDFVVVKLALRHPALDGPIAYLDGHALAPLLRGLPAGLIPCKSRNHGRIAFRSTGPCHRGLDAQPWPVRFARLGSAGNQRRCHPRVARNH